jgi:hypothetical protein
MNLARQKVEASISDKALKSLYAKAQAWIIKLTLAMYPQEDMLILEKYNQTDRPSSISVYLKPAGHLYFPFDTKEGASYGPILVPDHPDSLKLDEQSSTLILDWQREKERRDKAITAALEDYKGLIYGVSTYEAVLEIWEEAAEIKDDIAKGCLALVRLSPTIVERIKGQVADRKKKHVA